MISLILFEYKKFFKRKKNIITLIIFGLIILGYIILNNSLDIQKTKDLKDIYNIELSLAQDGLKNFKNRYEENKISELKNIIEEQTAFIKLLEDRQAAYDKGDWRATLDIQLKIDSQLLDGIEKGKIVSGESSNNIQERIEKNKILYDKGIKPIIEENSMTSYNFIRLVTKEVFPLLLIIIILLLTGDVVSNENDEGTFKFLLTQPVSRNKIILSKMIALTSICLLSIFLIIGIAFLVLGAKFGFGSPHYPVKFYTGSYHSFFNNYKAGHELKFIDIRSFILAMIPLIILFIAAITAMGILISTLIQNSTASICTAVIIAVGINIFSNQLNLLKKIVHFIPYTYSDVPDVLNGNLLTRFNNGNITGLTGIIILIASIVIFNLGSIIVFKRKDITC